MYFAPLRHIHTGKCANSIYIYIYVCVCVCVSVCVGRVAESV